MTDSATTPPKVSSPSSPRSFGNADSRRRNILIAVSVLLPLGLWWTALGYVLGLIPLLVGWVALIGLVAT